MDTPSIYLTNSSLQSLYKAFYLAIDNKDQETYVILNSFIYQRTSACFEANNLRGFDDFTGFFVVNYEYALKKIKDSITYHDMYELCADRAARGLKEKAGFGFSFRFNDEKTDIKEKEKINRYVKIVLNRFSELIYTCLRRKDYSKLPEILNQLRQVSDRYNYQLTNLKWEIYSKRSKSPIDEELVQLRELEYTFEVESYVSKNVRLIFKAAFFWSFFLYNTKTISFSEFESLLKVFEEYRGYIEREFVEDVIQLRDASKEDEYSWSRWDHIDRMDGKVYSPPMASSWITTGSLIYMLRNRLYIDLNQDIMSSTDTDSFDYLISSFQSILNNVKKDSDSLELHKIINVQNEIEFTSRINSIEIRLDHLRKIVATQKEQRIVDLPLDQEYVNNFKTEILREWESQNSIRQLFSHFKKITTLTDGDDTSNLLQIGIRNNIWLGSKTNFIRDEDLHIPVFGIETQGRIISRSEENLFLSSLIKNNSIEVDDIITGIDKALADLTENNNPGSIIMIGSSIMYKMYNYSSLPDLKLTSSSTEYNVNGFRGTYKDVPLIELSSELSNDIIVVANFGNAFLLTQVETPGKANQILQIEVQEITAEDATSMIEKYSDYWKNEIPEGDAIIKLRNSVKVDIYLVERFEIENIDAYAVMYLKDSPAKNQASV